MQQLMSYMLESDIRVPATWRVLAALLQHPDVTQADLREITGLSHPVIVQQVRKLRHAGLINMGDPLGGQPGRPRTPMNFNWDFRRLLSIDVDRSGLTLQVTNLAGKPLEKPKTTAISAWTQEGIRKALQQAITKVLASRDPEWAGIGIAIPGLVSADGLTVESVTNITAWEAEALGANLTAKFGVPVLCERTPDALTRALYSENGTSSSLLAIDLRHLPAIGMGMVIDGKLASSATDCAFRLGHVTINGNTRQCSCGKTGCLQALFQASQEDPTQRTAAIDGLGRIVASLVTVFDPAHVVIQGDTCWGPQDLAQLSSRIHANCYRASGNGQLLADRPYRAEESLHGVATRLSSLVLDLRQGMLPRWASGKKKG
ncbi:MAG TPA: ROK family transcriptional regulator [Armatimonadota bacterium]|jgi:hypothetical protein